jgi:hypothetical protein
MRRSKRPRRWQPWRSSYRQSKTSWRAWKPRSRPSLKSRSRAATGTQAALADVDGVFRPLEYGYADYDDNALLSADGDELADAVEKDTFRAKVEIMGSYTYDTQIGGSTTVPQLKVRSLKVTGSSD